MIINVGGGEMDIRPGSIFRFLLESWFGSDWNEYAVIYVEKRAGIHKPSKQWMLHNNEGPATVRLDGTCEWWLNGDKLFCKTQKEFECYMRNKAFW